MSLTHPRADRRTILSKLDQAAFPVTDSVLVAIFYRALVMGILLEIRSLGGCNKTEAIVLCAADRAWPHVSIHQN